mmetsp:Transcript_55628/g.60241  ORF Transcript_55628/g.60241 Transcript_55628/m.60241 type:complete len:476 (+) Transcript_55628:153-1580(+)
MNHQQNNETSVISFPSSFIPDDQNRNTSSILQMYNCSANTIRKRMSLPESLRPLKKRRIITPPPAPLLSSSSSTDADLNMNVKKNVSWNDLKGNMIHYLEDPNRVFDPYYNERDIWYTRKDYDEFLFDRIRTIECLRGTDNNHNSKSMDSLLDDCYCIRGLEPYEDTKKKYHSKKLYHSTVIIEQLRQGIRGIKEPERFRFLVAPQSDLAIHRAQNRAAKDEKDVYPFRTSSAFSFYKYNARCGDINNSGHHHHQQQQQLRHKHRRSSMSALSGLQRRSSNTTTDFSTTSSTTGTSTGATTNSNTPSLFTGSIRRLQEKNARRLMGIYQQQNNGGVLCSSLSGSDNIKMTNVGHDLFRYSLRSDSLLGMFGGSNNNSNNPMAPSFASFGQQTIQQQQPMERVVCAGINSHRRQHHKQLVEQAMLAMRTTRFPIRRDTLSHLQQNTQNSSDYHYHPHHGNGALPIPTTAFIMDQKT